ncbi:hypothetical protein C8J57DRAFT_1250952 [Mycena rebaudengoi]|nr:hypothetical protein C8J57DRAFT_1250952 [Mycena rebaudengoi]
MCIFGVGPCSRRPQLSAFTAQRHDILWARLRSAKYGRWRCQRKGWKEEKGLAKKKNEKNEEISWNARVEFLRVTFIIRGVGDVSVGWEVSAHAFVERLEQNRKNEKKTSIAPPSRASIRDGIYYEPVDPTTCGPIQPLFLSGLHTHTHDLQRQRTPRQAMRTEEKIAAVHAAIPQIKCARSPAEAPRKLLKGRNGTRSALPNPSSPRREARHRTQRPHMRHRKAPP